MSVTFDTKLLATVLNPDVRTIEHVLGKAGHETRVVGGPVRSLVRNVVPADIDLCTDATPDAMLSLFDMAGLRVIPTGLQHGTLTVVMASKAHYEITTLRIDRSTDGRHAEVDFVRDFRLDAERRDFTMNAMSLNVRGQVFDYFGGVEDIRAGRIRFVGDAEQRVTEDFLRAVRYYRFHGVMPEATFDPAVAAVLGQPHILAGIGGLAGQRIHAEMWKILASPRAVEILAEMERTGVLEAIRLPAGSLERLATERAVTADPLALLVHHAADADSLDRLADAWVWSNDLRATAQFLFERRDSRPSVKDAQDAVLRGDLPARWAALFAMLGQPEAAEHITAWKKKKCPVTGEHLLDFFPRGKALGDELRRLQDLWMESGYSLTKDELLAQVQPAS